MQYDLEFILNYICEPDNSLYNTQDGGKEKISCGDHFIHALVAVT